MSDTLSDSPRWPMEIQQNFQPGGYSEVMDEGIIRDQPQIGPAMVHKKSLGGVTTINGTIQVGPLVLAAKLEAFYRVTCQRGAIAFLWAGNSVAQGANSTLTLYQGLEDVPGIEGITGMEDFSSGTGNFRSFQGLDDVPGIEDITGMEDLSEDWVLVRFVKAPKWSCDASGINWLAGLVLEVMP